MVILNLAYCPAIEIERFEHLDSDDGLSQNSVLSIYCDHKGFIWLGTMDGLNRYDGYTFKIFKSQPGSEHTLTNNRIQRIWEDEQNFLWIVTYDGYVHWYDPSLEEFYTIPFYQRSEEERSSSFACFYQATKNEIWIGTHGSGVYRLEYDSVKKSYFTSQILSRGINAITNNTVRFVQYDYCGNLWVGTRQGINKLITGESAPENYRFEHFHISFNFTSAAKIGASNWFGTSNHGLLTYDCHKKSFIDLPELAVIPIDEEITFLKSTSARHLVIGTAENGLYILNPDKKQLDHYTLHGNRVTAVYEDRFGELWVNTEEFGVTRINPHSGSSKFFQLTPDEIAPLVDEERQYYFEDSEDNLWIGLHGAGLAHYQREENKFEFYRNNPNDPNTISSNFVHCITEDKSGLIWLGTGQFNGGVNKVIAANPSFRYIIPEVNIKDIADNVIRSVYEDSYKNIWIATKSGTIHIYDSTYHLITSLDELPLENTRLPGYNIYSILQDTQGYIWLGSKGGGVAVSTTPLLKSHNAYENLRFRLYQHEPGDSYSLSHNAIYSMVQDKDGRIWIGTFGGGLNLVLDRTDEKLKCRHINHVNSNLTADGIRNLCVDSKNRLWIATVFGINMLEKYNPDMDSVIFRWFNYDPRSESTISYNDVVHIYEDSRDNLWFATFGGGVNRLIEQENATPYFQHFNHEDNLTNDAVFGILEDYNGFIWFSTEKGISRYNPATNEFENYDQENGLQADHFSENTCTALHNGKLIFGSTNGALVIDPKIITRQSYIPPIVFTNFQLFNKQVDFHSRDAPFNRAIDYLDEIVLKHYQSSFSIEYAALSYFDAEKNSYQYKLEGFDETWNEVGNLTRATYTNLSPGKYEFRVKAASWDGSWNPEPKVIKIIIQPPWYRTYIAFILYGIMAVIIGEFTRRVLAKYNRMRNDLLVERRVNEIKLQFFTNVSHEIRTPLTLILGPLADIKIHQKLPANLQKSIEIMDRNGKRMLRLVNQLLDFRKIQKNKMKLKICQIELVQFVKEICENFNQLAQQKHIKFSYSPGISKQYIWVDPDKFDSVLFNVLSNAFKFTKSHKKIEIEITKPDHEFISILCRDEGKGISKNKIPALFQRYTPLSGSEINYQGTGIGLALSHEIMKLHQGMIDVESIEGMGSEFTIRIRLGKAHFQPEDFADHAEETSPAMHRKVVQSEQIKADNTSEDTKHAPVGLNVLLVEDNDEIIDYIQHILGHQYSLIIARNGKEGLERVSEIQPDLIITDLMMPEMDGIEMTARLKNEFATSHIPVIMLTAKSQIEDQIQGIETGAEAYILKPFNADYLLAVISTILRQREIVIRKFRDKKDITNGSLKLTTKDEQFMNDITRIIEENYTDPSFNVEKLVEKSTVGRTVMYNKLKGLTGSSPVEFLREMRLRNASNLLIDSGYNVSEVGYMSGFNDIKYFSKCFKAHFGITPSEYKNRKAVN